MKPAKALFAYSLLYLFAIFAAYLADCGRRSACWRWRELTVMDTSERVTLTPSQQKAQRNRSVAHRPGAGRARRHLLCRDDRQVRPVILDRSDVRLTMAATTTRSTEDAALQPRRRRRLPRLLRRHGRRGLCRGAALQDVLPGHRLWRHHAARRAIFRQACSTATITVRFDTNTSGGMPWDFAPVERDMTMKIGETVRGEIPRHQPVRQAVIGPRHLQRARRRWPAPISTRSSASASPTRR